MEVEEEVLEPMSPSAQYLKSNALSLTILGVLESEIPIDDSVALPLLKDVFLPTNKRFSSIMVTDSEGDRKWKKVEVKLEDHLYVPIFPSGLSTDYYDGCLTEYMSKLGMEPLPQNRPLWEVHIFKYPTKNAAGNAIFKLHHSLGDGYSLMGAILSCFQRLDDPSLPLTFPTRQSSVVPRRKTFLQRVPRFFTGLAHTVYDFGWSMFKSSWLKDDTSPIRSGIDGVEFRPIVTTTTTFSIDQLKEIKSKLGVTINDVVTGIISMGTRLYMQKTNEGSEKSKLTVLVVFNTRALGGYKSVDEMIKPNSEMPWGNRFTFLQVPIPILTESEVQKPLDFVKKSHEMIKRQKNSASIFLTAQLLNLVSKVRGNEATARYIHATFNNTSLLVSNLIGPVEKMELAGHPCNGLYYALSGIPQSLTITMISYVGKLRIAITSEKEFIDENKLKSCVEYAFELIYKAALET